MSDVQPGTRCPTCDQRVPKPRRSDSPPIKKIVAGGPPERVQGAVEALDALQAYVGADGESYPRLTLLELLVMIGGQRREELRDFFQRYS